MQKIMQREGEKIKTELVFFIQNKGCQKKYSFKVTKEKIMFLKLEIYFQRNYISKLKANQRVFSDNKR
jgi:hypothetical protein